MDNQHREIKGYRELSADEIALMNAVKEHAEATKGLIGKLHQLNSLRFGSGALRPMRTSEAAEQAGESNRWAALAKTQLQQGYMALNRAIALPTTF